MLSKTYLGELRNILSRIEAGQMENIARAAQVMADAIGGGGVVHVFGTGHSHLLAEEVFYRAGGIVAVNPILDGRLIFLEGALESTRAEREPGYAKKVLARQDVRAGDAAILISNSGVNVVPVEMALEMKARGLSVVAITNLTQSRAAVSRHPSGKRLFELADVVVDTCTPVGDAVLAIEGAPAKVGPSSTVAGAAIMNSIVIEAVGKLLEQHQEVAVFPSANLPGMSEERLADIIRPYTGRIPGL